MVARKAYAAVGMLITLLIIAVLFVILMPQLKDTGSGGGLYKSPRDIKSAESEAYSKIKEIESLRQQAQEEYNKTNQDF